MASSVAFTIVRVVIVPLASFKVKTFPALSRSNQLLCCNTAVSILHSALSSLLAIWALLTSHSLNDDYVNTVTKGEFLATAVSTGYFAYDLGDYVMNGLYIKSPSIVLHHIVVLICYISALTQTVGVPLLSFALSSLLRWIWRAQWVSFALVRLVPHAVIVVLTYQARNLFKHQLHFAMAFGGMIIINVLNAQLFFHVRMACQKDYASLITSPPMTKSS